MTTQEPRPFRARVFLFRMLATIFIVEAGFLAIAFWGCTNTEPGQTVIQRCPKLSEKSEALFLAAITTTLSLLTGSDRQPK